MLFSVLGGEGQQKLIVPIESSGNWVGDTRNGCRRSRPVSWDYNALGSLLIHKQTYGRCWTKKKKRKEMKQNRPTWLSWQTRKTRIDQTASLYFNASSPLSPSLPQLFCQGRGGLVLPRLGPTASRKDGDRSIDRRGPPGVLARLVEINSWSVK